MTKTGTFSVAPLVLASAPSCALGPRWGSSISSKLAGRGLGLWSLVLVPACSLLLLLLSDDGRKGSAYEASASPYMAPGRAPVGSLSKRSSLCLSPSAPDKETKQAGVVAPACAPSTSMCRLCCCAACPGRATKGSGVWAPPTLDGERRARGVRAVPRLRARAHGPLCASSTLYGGLMCPERLVAWVRRAAHWCARCFSSHTRVRTHSRLCFECDRDLKTRGLSHVPGVATRLGAIH